MVTTLHLSGSKVQISHKRHSFSMSIDGTCIYYFDLAGRFIGAFIDGANYVRGLSGKILRKQAHYGKGLKTRLREELSEPERQALLQTVHREMVGTAEALREQMGLSAPEKIELVKLMQRVQTPEQLEEDAQRFHTIYRPISILPPDQYLSVVLQITEGCSHNRCTFCDFYRDRRFRIKSDQEVVKHIAKVKAFLGDAIRLRKSIFLADANAIVIPQRRLLHIFDRVHESFVIQPRHAVNRPGRGGDVSFSGIYSFMDMFDGRRKSERDFVELAERGLRRVYIGLETGSDTLLGFLKKAGNSQDAVATVLALKQAGIQVGVIIMLGVGGVRFSESHILDTSQVLNAMQLGKNDILYTSEFVEHPGMEYATLAREEAIRPLSRREMLEQRQQIAQRLEWSETDKPRMSNYDIREFIY